NKGVLTEIDRHMAGCISCIEELTELNRINSVMDVYPPSLKNIPALITVSFSEGNVAGVSGAGQWRLAPAAATRLKSEGLGEKAYAELDVLDSNLKIMPGGNGSFYIYIGSPPAKNREVKLYKYPGRVPVY